jgi:hypothetical protein
MVVIRSVDPLSQNVTLNLAAAQLESGRFPGTFSPRQINEDITLCRRMFEKGGFALDGTASPGQSALVMGAAA